MEETKLKNKLASAGVSGQYGRRFAVVAEEVRNLAAKSAEAANESTEYIEKSISRVNTGMKTANETAQMLHNISDNMQQLTMLASNIAAASNVQSTAVTKIDQGLIQVSETMQNISATAEESAASGEELSGQVEMLKELVGQFRLKI